MIDDNGEGKIRRSDQPDLTSKIDRTLRVEMADIKRLV
jgi:hypothetical protein